ncbi:MAG: Zn-ribbon domain-containing OB-fold protein [Deltaproteobacteria bacterium]|nr:Zn-ribbon domain-containing OB-fold protein [Deltaproteobacteria bacterium]MBW2121043.1 Zn-ribbon domain-containing OB-fold protein [Deltaproteobacteria bacterium]
MKEERDSAGRTVPIREGLFAVPGEKPERPYLLGSRCRRCGSVYFPRRAVCANCLGETMEEIPLSRRGRLYTYTIVRYPAPGLRAPYAVGYVDLPEGVRVFSVLTGWDDENLGLGIDMELVVERFGEDAEGNEVQTYKFRPLQG